MSTLSGFLANGGGQANGAGSGFHFRVGAYFSALAIGARNLGDLGFDGARVASIRVETEASVDDVLIETDAGGYIAIQAKTMVDNGSTLGSRLGSVADQFVRYWLCASSGQAEYGWNRPLNPSTDRLFLVVGPEASKPIRVHLRDVLEVHRSGTPLHAQPKVRREVFENFRGLLSQAWAKRTHKGPTDDELKDLLNVCAVRMLDIHDYHKRLAEEALRTALEDPDEAGTAFRVLSDHQAVHVALRGGADVAALRRVLAGGNGTETKKIVLLKPPRQLPENALLAWVVNNLSPVRQWRRLSDTCQWVDGIVTVDEIGKRPPDVVSANLATGLLIVPAILAQMAMFCFLGINLLNRHWVLGEYVGTTKVIGVFAYQIRHFIVAALHLRLTEESAVFLASAATETAVVACYVAFCSVRMKSGATGRARREFATYIAATALFKLNCVSWLVACCVFVLSLIGPASWFRYHGLALTQASFSACIFPTGIWIYFANRRRVKKTPGSAKDYLIPSVYSWFVALGATFAVLLWPGVFSQAFEPRVTLELTDACFTAPVGCTVDVLPENLPSPIVLDELHFNVSALFMDAHGAPIESGPHGTSASFRMQRSSTDTQPLYIREDGQSHGVVVSPRFICPPSWQGVGAPKLLIPRNPVYTTARLADAPSLDYLITVRVDFDSNYASLFRGAGSGCSFWP